jgi:ATP-binding cassette subfamily B protein
MKKEKYFGLFLMKYLKGQKKAMILLGVFFIGNIVLQILSPQVLSYFIDSAESGKALGYISMIVLMYMITIVLNMAGGVCESYFAQNSGWRITNSFRKDVMEHFLKIDMEHHEKWTSGEMITRLDEDVEGLFTYFYMLIFKLAGSTLLMAGILIALAVKNSIIAVAMLVFSIAAVWIFKAIQDYGTKLYIRRSAVVSKFNGIMKERVDNVIEIRTNAAEKYSLHILNEAMKIRFKESLPAGMMYSRLWSASTALDAVVTILSLGIAVMLWDNGLITLGTV